MSPQRVVCCSRHARARSLSARLAVGVLGGLLAASAAPAQVSIVSTSAIIRASGAVRSAAGDEGQVIQNWAPKGFSALDQDAFAAPFISDDVYSLGTAEQHTRISPDQIVSLASVSSAVGRIPGQPLGVAGGNSSLSLRFSVAVSTPYRFRVGSFTDTGAGGHLQIAPVVMNVVGEPVFNSDDAPFFGSFNNASGTLAPGLYQLDAECSALTDITLFGGLPADAAWTFDLRLGPARCRLDYNEDGVLNPDDIGDFISAYFTVPPVPGPSGYAEPCPDLDTPYIFGYAAAYNSSGSAQCGTPFPDNLGDWISDYFLGC